MPDFDVFSLFEFRKRTIRLHEMKKKGNCKRKSRVHVLLLSKPMLLNIVKKVYEGPVKIYFGQSKIHVRYEIS